MNHFAVYQFDATKFAHLRFIYVGVLGNHNKAPFKSHSFIMQSMFKVIHFHNCLN